VDSVLSILPNTSIPAYVRLPAARCIGSAFTVSIDCFKASIPSILERAAVFAVEFAILDPTGNDFCFVQNYLDDEIEGLYALLHDEAPSDSVFRLANTLLQTGTEPAILVSL
jgi:hypothetical protein